jgi:hypothetical protein
LFILVVFNLKKVYLHLKELFYITTLKCIGANYYINPIKDVVAGLEPALYRV